MDPISICEKVWQYAGEPIARQFGYLISYGDNLQKLKDEFDELEAERKSLRLRVGAARRNDEEILPNVQKWLVEVGKIKMILDEVSKARTDCSLRACPNPWSRYRLSKKAKKILTPQIIELKRKGNFDPISCPKPPVARWRVSSSTSFSKGNKAFNSRISAMSMIMDALVDPTINKIGLYGLGGVGKSSLAHDVASRAQGEKFTVVMVEVTQNPDYKKIQNEIGDMVGFKFDAENELIRADRLCKRLKQEKNLFVILDNLWERLDLDRIGIPSIAEQEKDKKVIRSTDDYKGCKLLLISRDAEVLSNQMSCEKIIRLDVLSENEARELFNEMAGIKVDSDPDLLSVATDVAKECAGMPVAIVIVARALRHKSLSEWRNALRQLQDPTLRDDTGWRKGVYAPIKLSYDKLETEQLKSIFLLSSIWSDSVSTSYLFKCCVGLGMFEGIDTLEGAEDSLHTLISKLKASCLFLDTSSPDWFTMHDIVCDFALSILSDKGHALTVRYKKLNEWPEKVKLENYKWISLYQSDIGKLPEELSCPRLEFFHLNNKDNDMRIPDGFFKELRGLRVLDLTQVNLPFLPNSIIHLTDLRTLCLDQCVLEDISMIGELKNLRALSLWGSIIQQLPQELGELTQLQSIDLTNCSKLKVIPRNVISKLKKLEEMCLKSSFNQWQYEGSNDESSANANLSELMNLPNLSTVDIHIPHASMLRKNMFSDRLKKYIILIGDIWEWSGKYETSSTLKLKLNASIHSEKFGIKKLMDRVEDLFLDEVNGIKSVLYDLNRAGFPHLKHLQIQNNSQIECIINLSKVHVHVAFPNLETLVLENMIQLEKLCDRQLPMNSFCKLTVIKVRNCDKLNNLFPVSIVRSLPKLVEIEISGCKLMQEIVDLSSDHEIDDDDEGILEFNQLRILRMSSLPALVCFCSYDERSLATTSWKEKQLETATSSNVITKEDRPNPSQHIFSEKVVFPSLDSLKLSALNFQNIWPDSISASTWANLTDLSVEGCQSLHHIMHVAVATSFVKLRHLSMCRCDMVEMIIFPNATHTSFSEKVIFPNLETMVISHMDNLQIIWPNQFAANSFAKIKNVEISYCGKLVTIIPSHMLRTLRPLETLTVGHCGSLDTIFDVQGVRCNTKAKKVASRSMEIVKLEEYSYCDSVEAEFDLQGINDSYTLPQLQLKSMKLWHLPKLKCVWNEDPQQSDFCQHLQNVDAFKCGSLRSIFPASIAKHLPKLELLNITSCIGVEVIVERDEVAGVAPCFEFPQLHTVTLWNLSNLKNFYPEAHTSEWPQLRVLKVYKCPNVEVFESEIPSTTETHEKDKLEARHPLFVVEKVVPNLDELVLNQKAITTETHEKDKLEVQHPLFFVEKVVPNLEALVLNQNAITMIRKYESQVDLLHKVKLLYLESFNNEPVTFPYSFLERLPNLNELHVWNSSFEEIFPSQGPTGNNLEKYAPLKILDFFDLEQLKIIWHTDSQVELVLQNLEVLKVQHCSSLINLAPSSASFDSLTKLKVIGCHQLAYLVTSSTAMSLVHLTTLKVSDCKMIEEIVTTEEENVGNAIAMPKLECLELTGLSSMKAFCSFENYSWHFLSLYKVIVRECPRLSMFCTKIVTTPLLMGVEVAENMVYWDDNLNNTVKQLYAEKVAFRSMEKIKLDEYPELIDMWDGKLSNWSFSNLKSLIVENCDFLSCVIPSYLLNSFGSLEELQVSNCNFVHTVFDLPDIKELHTLPQLQLKSMNLWHLPELKCVWNKDPQKSDFCQHLQNVVAFECGSLRSIFPASIAKDLPKLEWLNIDSCIGVEVIVERDEVEGVAPCFEYPQLHTLMLWKLPNLKNFYPERHTFQWPQLRDLEVYMCPNVEVFGSEISSTTETHEKDQLEARHPLFLVEKVVPNLEALVLNQKAITIIRKNQFQVDLLHKVKLLYLESFNNEPVTFPYSLLERLPNLNELHVWNSSFEEIFPSQGPTGNNLEKYAPLKILDFFDLQQLKIIWHSDSQMELVLPNLEVLCVRDCSSLINLAPSSASFDSLTKLEVTDCHQLAYLVTSSTAMSLVHLTTLKISNCKMIEEIVTVKEENVGNAIAMPKLECLELSGLSSMKAFCSSENYSWDFPSLYKVIIRECPRLSMFCTRSFTTSLLKGVDVAENTVCWDGNLNQTVKQLYAKKIAFRNMEKIELVEYPELIDIWEGKLSNWPFSNLKSLIVDNCDFLSYVIPSYLLNLLSNLEELVVTNCNSVEAVFDIQDMKEPHALPQLQLKGIVLWRLPKLKSVWNKDPQQINFCQHLHMVIVSECESLSSIFPASIAKYLSKLQELRIIGCVRVEVIVEKDEVTGVAPCFEFPQLHMLKLWKLPNLKNFYPETHTTEWPQLRDLKVYMCPNVEVFGSEIPSTTETHAKDKLEARHPLFFVEKVVPNLEELVLNQNAVTMIRNNQFQVDLFHKVKLLYLESFTDELVTFPCSFLEWFPNLNELHVNRSSFVEIFPSQGATGSNLGKYAPIKILDIAYLEQLKIIWHSDSQVELLLQNLERLKVESCSSLVYLAPSSASFDSLRELEVSGSHQLIYLLTFSTAKSLVNLKILKVNDCKIIDEIIADEGEIEEKEIPLKELECLELTDLPNLKSFCSQDYKFKFPSLNKVAVRGCPNMMKFCSGVLATPLLQGVRVEENKKHWEGDLNKTIEHLFLKKDGQNSSGG